MVLVLGRDHGGVALVDDEDPVEEFAVDVADESLGDGVGPWKLVDVGAEGSTRMWPGGSPGRTCTRPAAISSEDKMLAAGEVTATALGAFRSVVSDRGVTVSFSLTVVTRVRRLSL